MTAFVFILITIILIVHDERDTRRKRKKNQETAQKHIEEFEKSMAELERISRKDYTKP